MAKPKQTKAAEAKPGQLTIQVDQQEFVRTRDALITSWVTLEGALRDATRAYISHSNAVLAGTKSVLDTSNLDLTTFVVNQLPPVAADVKGDEPTEAKAKLKRQRKPKDPNAPKRPLTAYLAWLGDNRQRIHAELGSGQGRGGISSEGTKRWHALSDATKQDYKDKYEKETEKYKEELAAYKARGGGALPAEDEDEAEDEVDADEQLVEAAPAAAAAETASPTDSDSDSDSDADGEKAMPPPKAPTPPPVKTPRSAKKASAKKAPAVPASSPPLPASSPAKNAAFTAVNGAAKRKNASKAEPAEEPKKKRTRKEVTKDAAPASTPVEAAKEPEEAPSTTKREKRDRKKSRKSQGGDA
ncbi:hypothetical protein AAFC00_000098 [Neodothiora populina]|uniref:HMG box domain-containing protein n=1 Tax=Neodothiora populina TaxID=2781224 RepID=A0ABR3P1K1_9PEZI